MAVVMLVPAPCCGVADAWGWAGLWAGGGNDDRLVLNGCCAAYGTVRALMPRGSGSAMCAAEAVRYGTVKSVLGRGVVAGDWNGEDAARPSLHCCICCCCAVAGSLLAVLAGMAGARATRFGVRGRWLGATWPMVGRGCCTTLRMCCRSCWTAFLRLVRIALTVAIAAVLPDRLRRYWASSCSVSCTML